MKRNFQVLAPLDFIAEFTQHTPPKGAHLVRYYGWYSNKSRGVRQKAADAAAASPLPPGEGGHRLAELVDEGLAPARASRTWAMLIKRVYEVDPLCCPHCGGEMKVVAFIEPPQGDVIERILRHCGLWQPRPPPGESCLPGGEGDVDGFDASGELTYVDEDTFWATF